MSVAVLALVYTLGFSPLSSSEYRLKSCRALHSTTGIRSKLDYDARLLALAQVSTTTLVAYSATTSVRVISTSTPSLWPVSTVYPNARAIFPFKRVVAYYGNFYSKAMGVLRRISGRPDARSAREHDRNVGGGRPDVRPRCRPSTTSRSSRRRPRARRGNIFCECRTTR